VPATALVAVALSAASLSAAPPSWGLPVDGTVVAGFRYDAAHPFAAGSRRGVDLRAAAGSPVRAACSGRVSHAGAVPRWAVGVSVRCGRFVATHLGLRRLLVHRGDRVRRGQPIGRVGAAGVVRLGARRSTERFGWVDPIALVARERPRGAPLGPAPPASARRPALRLHPAPRPALRLHPAPRPALRVHPSPRAARPAVVRSPPPAPGRDAPMLAWIAAALIATGLPVGPVLVARRRRRRAAARTAGAAADGGRGPPIF
jgi:hypothetical protein